MIKLLVIVALFLHGSQAQKPWIPRKTYGDTYDDERSLRFRGVTGMRTVSDSHICMKDLLLILDTSLSVEAYFEKDMKPFLKMLVTDKDLHVSRDGTQIALMIFSEEEKTKVLLDFGEIYDADKLAQFIDKLNWDDIKGGFTRTDLAFQMANNKVFTQESPKNNRPDIDDVVAIITDGNPWGVENILEKTMKNANLVKEKGIVIVGAAVGSEKMRAEFRPKLEAMATSPEHVVQADFKDINTIRSKFIENTCMKPRKMCGDKAFDSNQQECCCGTIHNQKLGFKCCGPKYYNPDDYKCCDYSHLVSSTDSCPIY